MKLTFAHKAKSSCADREDDETTMQYSQVLLVYPDRIKDAGEHPSQSDTVFREHEAVRKKRGGSSHFAPICLTDCGVAVMRYASIPWPRAVPAVLASRENIGFFRWILESLHSSRRLQAARFLRTHRHLIGGGRDEVLVPRADDQKAEVILSQGD